MVRWLSAMVGCLALELLAGSFEVLPLINQLFCAAGKPAPERPPSLAVLASREDAVRTDKASLEFFSLGRHRGQPQPEEPISRAGSKWRESDFI